MRFVISILLMVFLVFADHQVLCQVNPQDACRIEDGKIVFRIDLNWTPEQRKEFSGLFEVDSTILDAVWAGKNEILTGGDIWDVKRLTQQMVELSKNLGIPGGSDLQKDQVIMIDDKMVNFTVELSRESSPYGVNKFTLYKVFRYTNGVARFHLPGKTGAKQVFLSGTFNDWSTLRMPMQQNDSGWTIQISLKPGKYLYKYIIDGRWISDPFNRQLEYDGNGGNNSVVFCYNHWFMLRDHMQARDVRVAGSFNRWNDRELRMIKMTYGWVLPLYLREGTHAYKFLVDGEWINDPDNKTVRPDGSGHMNSFVGIGKTMTFRLSGYPGAKKVMLAGNFNAWNPAELSMDKVSDGWKLDYVLAPGTYEYKFIVDGKWITDPANPFFTGTGDLRNSLLILQPNHTFVLHKYQTAKTVCVAGSFNGWNAKDYKMILKDGEWVFPIFLKPGKYTYKFVVDSKWILDPGNELWEENEYGNGNSVLWIGQ